MGSPLFACRGKLNDDSTQCEPNEEEIGWTVEGIASWTTNPCGYNFPGVYTRIDFYTEWIDETIFPATTSAPTTTTLQPTTAAPTVPTTAAPTVTTTVPTTVTTTAAPTVSTTAAPTVPTTAAPTVTSTVTTTAAPTPPTTPSNNTSTDP